MKSRETLIRLRRFEVDEKRQKVADIESMIADFRQMVTDLERQIQVEQERAGVSDVNHFAYPIFAMAVIQRREEERAHRRQRKPRDHLQAPGEGRTESQPFHRRHHRLMVPTFCGVGASYFSAVYTNSGRSGSARLICRALGRAPTRAKDPSRAGARSYMGGGYFARGGALLKGGSRGQDAAFFE